MTKWEEKRLGEVAPFKYGKSLTADKRSIGKYNVYSSAGICGLSDKTIAKNGIVVGRKGSIGTVFYSPSPFFCIDTAFYIDSFDPSCNPKFLYYYLPLLHLKNYNTDAAVPGLNRNLAERIKIKLPDLPTQEKIAEILSAYDDLIENNNKRIALLEKAAQELYKEWFIRFRFPGYENAEFENGLPKGWEVKRVKELVKRLPYGKLYKEKDVLHEGNTIVIDQSKSDFIGFHNNVPSHIATIDTPILLFGDHSCKYKLMITSFSLSENVIPFIPQQNIIATYLFYTINGLVETTEYKRHWSELMCKKVLLAKPELQKMFNSQIKTNLMLIEQISTINRNLIKQRNLLLPRLMSGKLEA